MVRWLAVGVVLSAIAPTGPVSAQSEVQTLYGLTITYRAKDTVVRVFRGSFQRGDFPKGPIQAWVLKSDGTGLRQQNALPEPITICSGRQFGPERARNCTTVFSFEPARSSDVAAVVVNLDGALSVQAIPQKPAK